MKRFLLCPFLFCIFCIAASAASPLLLFEGPNRSGLDQFVLRSELRTARINKQEYTESLADGRTVQILVQTPAAKETGKVSAIIFVAPAPTDNFSTAQSAMTKSLVTEMGCAVVGISMDAPKSSYWVREKFYVYPEAGYFSAVEKAIAKTRLEHGDESTPVFCVGKSAGGVMALYIAQSKTLDVAGVVAFHLSQDADLAPDMLDVKMPTLIINPENSPWNGRMARIHAEALEKGVPAMFCIGRPVIKTDSEKPYSVRSAGHYGDELAYCFLRDAIEASQAGDWPGRWQRRSVKIEGVGESWEDSVYCSSDDFARLYQLATHNTYEAAVTGECAYSALPPFFRRHAVLIIKKGIWHYMDQVRLGAMLVDQGCAAVVCSAPDSESAASYMTSHLERLKKTGLPVTVIVMMGKEDASWETAITFAASETPCVIVRRGEALILPPKPGLRMKATLGVLPGYKKKDYENVLFAVPTWVHPRDFDSLIGFLLSAGDPVATN